MTGPMGHDRCYRNRITERWYINTATGGSDFLALNGSGEFPHPWVRSTCGIGILPCNGLLYAGPPACSCANQVQLNAFSALAPEPGLKSSGQPITVAIAPQLAKGPAYAATIQPPPAVACRLADLPAGCQSQWPYQHGCARHAATPVADQVRHPC